MVDLNKDKGKGEGVKRYLHIGSRGKREISWDRATVKVLESHRVSTPFLLRHFPLSLSLSLFLFLSIYIYRVVVFV